MAPRSDSSGNRLLVIKPQRWNAAPCMVSTREGRGVAEQPDGIGLAEALEQLRAELAAAQKAAAESNFQFPIETLTVELKVAVTKTKDGKAGFRVPFVGAELAASAGVDRERLQTVTLVLGGPVDREGRPVKVARASREPKR